MTATVTEETFDPAMTRGLPEPARRWLRVRRSGRLAEIRVERWGNPGGAPFGRYPFGVRVEAEATFGGITIPSVFRAGWWWGTDRQREGEFFRAEITGVVFS
jgi:Family of unknown function (DUF6920)